MWKVVVLRDRAAQARKIRKCSVRREREHGQNRSNRHIVENAFAEHRSNEHGEQALVARLSRVGSGNAINFGQIGDSRQQHRQQKDNHGESALRVFYGGLAKSLHAVADGLHAGQGCATAGKDF